MKLQFVPSNVELSNVGAITRCQMEVSGKTFRLMSNGIYQNKIGSMVREVSANAYDSHIMAGCRELPFQIHLPDVYEPWFSVRDFGLGLDDDGVRNVFLTYFKSTKDADNETTGAFGLGSKTPFAYTDAFTVTAIKDGVQRRYSVFTAEDGEPSCAMLDEMPTDEGNGLEVLVPVTTTEDFRRFRREVQDQLTFFTVKPTLLNVAEGEEIEWMDWQGASSYMNCERVLIGGASTSFRGVWLIQGVVGYRMDVNVVKQSLTSENAEFLDIIGNAALLKFNLGEIEVTPSREGVSYTRYTLANIEKALDEARLSLAATIQTEMDALPDAWAKAHAVNTNDTFRRLTKAAGVSFDAPGFYRTSGYYYMELERIANIDAALDSVTPDADEDDEDADDNATSAALSGLQFRAYTCEYVRRKWRWKEYGIGKNAKCDNTLTIMVKDTTDKPVVRTREHLETVSSNTQVFMLHNRDGSVVTADQLAEIQARIGQSFEFVLLSEVELPAPEARSGRGYKSPTAYTYGKNDSLNSTRYWEREYASILEFEDGAYYTTVDRCSMSNSALCQVVTTVADAGMLDRPIVAIRYKDVARIANNPKWVPLQAKAEEILATVADNKALRNAYALTQHKGVTVKFMDDAVAGVLRDAYAAGTLAKDNPLVRLFRIEATLAKLKERAQKRGFSKVVQVAFRVSGIADSIKSGELHQYIDNEVKRICEETKVRYPLLAFLDNACHNGWTSPATVGEHILAYVNAGA